MFGLETEYACVPILAPGRPDAETTVPDLLMETARRTLSHLPDRRSPGMFLQNGARFYVDCGSHPEYATPECDNPWDAVRHVLAGDQILRTLLEALRPSEPALGAAALFKHNVDLSGSGATWGCHESYLHHIEPDVLTRQITPHLVSRVIYTGAGGFHPLAPGVEFTLSPRVAHLTRVVSPDSTSNRGIYHTKNEPLGRGHSRLHVICGESLCSHRAAWLKIGATAVVVALLDTGVDLGERVTLRAPLKAIRAFAADPTCSVKVPLENGERVSAIELQTRYLTLVEANLDHPALPRWTAAVCREWRAMLERLRRAPASVRRTLDWAIKWSVYDQWIQQQGWNWSRIESWRPIIRRLQDGAEQADVCFRQTRIETLLADDGPLGALVRRLTPAVRLRRLEWGELIELSALQRQLYELETRFSQLSARGVFQTLDQTGVLDHRVDGVDNVDDAVTNPPGVGRARARGEAIRRLAGQAGWSCGWTAVWNHGRLGRALDLSDPFTQPDAAALDRLCRGTTVGRPARVGDRETPERPVSSFFDHLWRL